MYEALAYRDLNGASKVSLCLHRYFCVTCENTYLPTYMQFKCVKDRKCYTEREREIERERERERERNMSQRSDLLLIFESFSICWNIYSQSLSLWGVLCVQKVVLLTLFLAKCLMINLSLFMTDGGNCANLFYRISCVRLQRDFRQT